MKRISLPIFCLGFALSLSLGSKAIAADGFWILGNDLPLAGQTGWTAYEGGDSLEGGYLGTLNAGTTNRAAVISLGRTLPAGRYYVLVKVIDYDSNGRIEAVVTGDPLVTVDSNDRDWNRYWTVPIPVLAFQQFSELRLNFLKTVALGDPQKYLLRGLYITTNPYENVPLFGFDRIVDYEYPLETNTSESIKGNLIQNGSFEVGMGHGWGFAAQTFEREFAISGLWDTNSFYHGTGSMRFPTKGKLISRIFKIRPNQTYMLSAWVRSSAPSEVMLRIYNVATPPPGFPPVKAITQTFATGTNWQRVSIGGFLPSYPHRDYQVLIGGNANVWVDAIQLEEGGLSSFGPHASVEIGFGSVQPGRILYEEENPALDLLACNSSAQPFSGTIVFEIFDVFNRKISSGERPLSVPPGNSVESFSVPGRRGIFRIVAWIKDGEGTLEESVYAVIPRPRVSGTNESSIIGVHPNLTPFPLITLERLGVKWARTSSPEAIFRWEIVEPVEGQITWYDEKVDRAADYGIAIMGTVGSEWPSWATSSNGLPDLDKWESFVERLVTHYRGRVLYWEVWNEAVHVFRSDFYAELLRRAAAAIHRADPDAKIVGMGGAANINWVLEVMGHLGDNWRQYLDYISTHIYPATTEPSVSETADIMLRFKREVIDRFGIEVWNTETAVWDEGFYKTANSSFGPIGEAMWPYLDSERYFRGCYYEADRLLVNFLHCIGNGLTKYFYYDSRIVDPAYLRSHPTIIEYDDAIRSKGIAYAIAAHFFDGARGLGNLSPTNTTYAYLFDRVGTATIAVWSHDRRKHVVHLSGSGWTAFDMMGNAFPVANGEIPFGRAPVYVQNPSLGVEAMRLAFQSAAVSNVADTQPPNLSIDEFPTGPTTQHDITFRWVGIDETSIPAVTLPDVVTYSYWLQGRDADWSAWTPATHVSFSSLNPGDYTFRVKARDAAGNITVESRALRIITPTAPVLASIGNQTINEGSELTFTAMATDPDLPSQSLTFSLDAGAPSGATIDPATGVFRWTPTEAQGPSMSNVTIRVTDSGSPPQSDSETITITVNEVNGAPALAAIGNKTINEGGTLNFTATATDADLPAQTLAFSLEGTLPAGVTLDPTTGAFSWTPTEGQGPGSYTVTIRVTDNGSPAQSHAKTISIMVNEVNATPVLSPIGNKTVKEGTLLSFQAAAGDSDAPSQALAFSLDVGAPAGASIDPNSGVFSWTPTEAQGPGTPSVTIRVTDNGSPALSDFETIVITVTEANSPPALGAIGNKTTNEGSLLTFTATASDSDTPPQT